MTRFRSVRTGVVVDVDDNTATNLSRHFWEPAEKAKATSTRKRAAADKSDEK